MRVLALDFDGVICDSAPECFAVALDTYLDLEPGSALRAERDGLQDGGPWRGERIRRSPLYAGFVESMPLGNRAEDYGAMLRALESARPLPDQAAYDAFRSEIAPAWLDRFHLRFYERRDDFAARDPAGWRALMAPYTAFTGLLRRRAGSLTLAIATSKDRTAVERLLLDYGLSDLFARECVLDKEMGVEKRFHLLALASRLDVPPTDITFVDDKVNHLERVADLGVRCALAAWGYNGERERRIARERGFLVCSLEDAEEKLFGPAPSGA